MLKITVNKKKKYCQYSGSSPAELWSGLVIEKLVRLVKYAEI